MHIWNVHALKHDLALDGLSARQELGYLVPVLSAIALSFVTVPEHNVWSAAYGGFLVLVIWLGSTHAYHCNGGASGHDFLMRFVSIAFVCTMRLLTFVVVPITATLVVVPGSPWTLALPGEMPPLQLFDVAVRLVFLPPLFWVIGRHLRELAALPPRKSAEPPAPDHAGLEPLED